MNAVVPVVGIGEAEAAAAVRALVQVSGAVRAALASHEAQAAAVQVPAVAVLAAAVAAGAAVSANKRLLSKHRRAQGDQSGLQELFPAT